MLYDTTTVHPLDRYEYYRVAAASELAPVTIRGRSPGQMLATMSSAQIGDFTIEAVTWASDSEIVAQRTHRLIRAGDPDCYRICVSVNGREVIEQAGNQVLYGARDVALYDVSRPYRSTRPTGPEPMRVVMLTFPRASVPVRRVAVQPLIGSLMPRDMPGRNLIAQFLVDLTDAAAPAEHLGASELADVLHECTVGLIRQRLGQPNGITPRTHRLLHMARIRDHIRRYHGNPALDPAQIARAANISPRYLHTIFQNAELTPMQFLKRVRLEGCHRDLHDPALTATPIKEIMSKHGYRRPDQFARDFKELFGVSPNRVRRTAG